MHPILLMKLIGTTGDYFFGNDKDKIARYANSWQGKDHLTADSSEGYMYTSPAGSFKANHYGLYDVHGHVLEFCSKKVVPGENNSTAHVRGGSWWCSKNSCDFFNSYDIGSINIHASFSNQGFHVVKKTGE